jgi:hypothetical protein
VNGSIAALIVSLIAALAGLVLGLGGQWREAAMAWALAYTATCIARLLERQ